MKVKNRINSTTMRYKDFGENIIGIQGEQGNNRYDFHDAGCSDIAYIVKKESEMNIYNYFQNTGIRSGITSPMGPVGPSGPILTPPTETCMSACIDRSRYSGKDVSVTTSGYTLPLKRDYNSSFSYNTDSDQSVTLKDGGTYLTMKLLTNWP